MFVFHIFKIKFTLTNYAREYFDLFKKIPNKNLRKCFKSMRDACYFIVSVKVVVLLLFFHYSKSKFLTILLHGMLSFLTCVSISTIIKPTR